MNRQMYRVLEIGTFGALGLGALWCLGAFVVMVVAFGAAAFDGWAALFEMVGGDWSAETQARFWQPSFEVIGLLSGVAVIPGLGLLYLGTDGRKWCQRKQAQHMPDPLSEQPVAT